MVSFGTGVSINTRQRSTEFKGPEVTLEDLQHRLRVGLLPLGYQRHKERPRLHMHMNNIMTN